MFNEKNLYTLKEAISNLLKSYNLDTRLNEVKLLSSWEKVMGAVIAKHTKEIFISRGKLFVKVDSAPLREELHYAREKMVKMLNDEIGSKVIHEIILK
jgi:predicted nucleic acid-binding Zn ribbon protein